MNCDIVTNKHGADLILNSLTSDKPQALSQFAQSRIFYFLHQLLDDLNHLRYSECIVYISNCFQEETFDKFARHTCQNGPGI